jgi:hypothetical protein
MLSNNPKVPMFPSLPTLHRCRSLQRGISIPIFLFVLGSGSPITKELLK